MVYIAALYTSPDFAWCEFGTTVKCHTIRSRDFLGVVAGIGRLQLPMIERHRIQGSLLILLNRARFLHWQSQIGNQLLARHLGTTTPFVTSCSGMVSEG